MEGKKKNKQRTSDLDDKYESLSYLDDREFTIIGVEQKDFDENKGIKITTMEEFDIQGEKVDKFHTTRQAIVGKFLNDAGAPTALYNQSNRC